LSVAARRATIAYRSPKDSAGTPDRSMRWQTYATEIFGLWALSRAFFLAYALIARSLGVIHTPRLSPGWHWVFSIYSRADSGHFVRVAEYGYFSRGITDVNVAFFPGYPAVGGAVARVLGLGRPTALDWQIGFTISAWLATFVAACLLYRYIYEESASSDAARVAVIALLFGPCAVFLMAPYSESLFLACALGAWLLGRRERWFLAALLCAAAALVRVNGLFLTVALAAMYLLAARREGRPLLRPSALSFFLPVASTTGYFFWLKLRTGRWDAWFDAEYRGWDRHTVAPWVALANSWRRVIYALTSEERFVLALELAFAAVYILLIIVLARRKQWPELIYVILTGGSLLTSNFYQSVPRSFLTLFPLYLLVAQWWMRRSWSPRTIMAVGSTGTLLILTSLFVRGFPSG